MQIAKGRNFSKDYPADGDKCLINETAARIFGWKDPIGNQIKVFKKDYEVIGVIKDYVAFSVHNPLEPHLYRLIQDSVLNDKVFTVKFNKGKEREAMKICKNRIPGIFS